MSTPMRVDLADAHVGEVVAGLAAVDRHVHAAVAAEDDALLVLRVPPHASGSRRTRRGRSRLSHVLPPSREMNIESLVTMTVWSSCGLMRIWLNEYGALPPATLTSVTLLPRLAAIVGAIQLVADDAGARAG